MRSWMFDARPMNSAARVLVIVGLAGPAAVLATTPDESSAASRQRRRTPVVDVFEKSRAAVVNIASTRLRTLPGGLNLFEMFDFPIAPRQYAQQSVGSGFIIHPDGYIVTNAHVVAQTIRRKIIFVDKSELNADIVAVDPDNDLAILKVDAPRRLHALPLGRSNDLMIGETVIAIGDPLGYQHTCTSGIVSALDRELAFPNDVVYRGLIQTDASINPGNSGGPLLNIEGRLVGINTAIRGDAQNIGFAIPVDQLRAMLPIYLDIERIRRVKFGIHLADEADFSEQIGNRSLGGVVVSRVDADSPAAKAGIHRGDVIKSLAGRPTPTFLDAFSVLKDMPAGKAIDVTLRRSGTTLTPSLALVDIPKPDGAKLLASRLGLHVREMTRRDLSALDMDEPFGLVVTQVTDRSEAARQGIEPGDIITKLGSLPIPSLDLAGHVLEKYVPHGAAVPVTVVRIGGNDVYTGVVRLHAS